jgi:hypothetical protein
MCAGCASTAHDVPIECTKGAYRFPVRFQSNARAARVDSPLGLNRLQAGCASNANSVANSLTAGCDSNANGVPIQNTRVAHIMPTAYQFTERRLRIECQRRPDRHEAKSPSNVSEVSIKCVRVAHRQPTISRSNTRKVHIDSLRCSNLLHERRGSIAREVSIDCTWVAHRMPTASQFTDRGLRFKCQLRPNPKHAGCAYNANGVPIH